MASLSAPHFSGKAPKDDLSAKVTPPPAAIVMNLARTQVDYVQEANNISWRIPTSSFSIDQLSPFPPKSQIPPSLNQSRQFDKNEFSNASSWYFLSFRNPRNKPLTHPDIKTGKGAATALYITDIPKPTPSKGEAIVKIKAFGLNRMDLLQRNGQYPVPPQAPKTLGVEFSGTVESLGEGCKDGFKVGDEVFGLA
jgi:hypothetical protein